MPLHDWSDLKGWEGVHDIWLVELLRCVKPQLPPGFRAHLGTVPTVSIDAVSDKPDVSVRHWRIEDTSASPPGAALMEPEVEVATLAIEPDKALLVTEHGKLAAAVEIISPRNKDRPASRSTYLARYLGYLKSQVNLLIVDVHPKPAGFSFADALARELDLKEASLPCPMAIAYEVRGPAPTGGSFVGMWRRQLVVGEPLPLLPLPLSVSTQLRIDLESTYSRAAADAYLS